MCKLMAIASPSLRTKTFQNLFGTGIDFLMRHVGRDKNEIAGIRFASKLQSVTPAHSRLGAHDIDYAFEVAVVMSAGFRIGLDRDRACPQFFGPGAGGWPPCDPCPALRARSGRAGCRE
jgi:hypothetical protein